MGSIKSALVCESILRTARVAKYETSKTFKSYSFHAKMGHSQSPALGGGDASCKLLPFPSSLLFCYG